MVRSPLNSCQEQPLKVTDRYCIGSQFVIELPELIDLRACMYTLLVLKFHPGISFVDLQNTQSMIIVLVYKESVYTL